MKMLTTVAAVAALLAGLSIANAQNSTAPPPAIPPPPAPASSA